MPNIRSFASGFGFGASLLFRSAHLVLTRPQLFFSCLIPWVLAALLSWYWMRTVSELSVSALSWLTVFLGVSVTGILASLMQFVLTLLAWITGALVLTWSAAFLMIPLADWISELTEAVSGEALETSGTRTAWFSRAQLRRIIIDFRKTILSLGVGVLGLLLAHIPILGFLGPVVVALGLCFQFVSYPQTRRDQGVRQSLYFLVSHLGACLGFGLSLLIVFSIPFVSVLAFPLAVVGGTLLFLAAQPEKKLNP